MLLLAPDLTFRLMFSNGSYGDIFPRISGVFMIGLSAIVIQIIRHRIEVLYTTTMAIRTFFLLCFILFFVETKDPFFLIVIGVTGDLASGSRPSVTCATALIPCPG